MSKHRNKNKNAAQGNHVGVHTALRDNGTDILDGSNKTVPPESVTGAVNDLANAAKEAYGKQTDAKSSQFKEVAGLTASALDFMCELDDTIVLCKQKSKAALESARSSKSAMSIELNLLRNLVKETEKMNLKGIADDLERITKALENPRVRTLLKGDSQ